MEIEKLQSAFRDFLNSEKTLGSPPELYEPIQYIMSIGGKRIRPLLTLMSYNLYKEDIKKVLPIAYAIELFHNFTLMHDDIMDEADLRRGKPAVHQKYSINAGILSGDAMLLKAYKYLLGSGLNVDQVKLFNHTAIKICEGQQMDMNFETTDEVSIEAYLEMIKLKTAVLLGLALQLGAIHAGASSQDVDHLYAFGINMGIAFQLHDDMLDAFGSSADTGKRKGGDILQGKQTYLHLKTKSLLDQSDLRDYTAIFKDKELSDDAKISGIMKYYESTVVKEYSLQTEEAYFNLAISHLDAVQVDAQKKHGLKNLAHGLMERVF